MLLVLLAAGAALAVAAQNPPTPAAPPPTRAPASEAAVPAAAPVAAPVSGDAQAMFERVRDSLIKVRVVHRASKSQASVGSGFSVDRGLAITNYHVVSEAALEPGFYALEFVRPNGDQGVVEIVHLDVVNDLALIKLSRSDLPALPLRAEEPARGARGFSLGHPLDLGAAIVEGIYNGPVEHTVADRYHFTGAINSGMSGGPAVDEQGQVIGVNVSRMIASDLVTFLVPVHHARALLAAAPGDHSRSWGGSRDWWPALGEQLDTYQRRIAQRVFVERLPRISLGSYTVPGDWGAFMECWGRTTSTPTDRYTSDHYSCSSGGSMFVGGALQLGDVQFRHVLLRNQGLTWLQFAQLSADHFAGHFAEDFELFGEDRLGRGGAQRTHTPFRCHDDFVTAGERTVRAALCLRGYVKLPALYEVWLKVSTVDRHTDVLQSELALAGFSFEDGVGFARRYLDNLLAAAAE